MTKILHNPRCKKSREGLAYLKEKSADFEIVDYLKEGLTKDLLKEILVKSKLPVESLIRKQEDYFKKELKGKDFSENEWIQIIIDHPKLLQRPIVVGTEGAVLAQPPHALDAII